MVASIFNHRQILHRVSDFWLDWLVLIIKKQSVCVCVHFFLFRKLSFRWVGVLRLSYEATTVSTNYVLGVRDKGVRCSSWS